MNQNGRLFKALSKSLQSSKKFQWTGLDVTFGKKETISITLCRSKFEGVTIFDIHLQFDPVISSSCSNICKKKKTIYQASHKITTFTIISMIRSAIFGQIALKFWFVSYCYYSVSLKMEEEDFKGFAISGRTYWRTNNYCDMVYSEKLASYLFKYITQ